MKSLIVKKEGLYCSAGKFYIDAWRPVSLCVITHAHSDHLISGHGKIICSKSSLDLIKHRLGNDTPVQAYGYGEKFILNESEVSLHPAGHILGSSQVRMEIQKKVTVVSGDYKREYDPTCEPFEVVKCHTFVTETTFSLPIYHWEPSEEVIKKIYQWWINNSERGFSSVLYCYSLGKAQRVMALLGSLTNKPVYVHGSILPLAEIYVRMGISLIPFLPISENKSFSFKGELIIASPLAKGTPWLKRFYPYKSAYVSGWMQVRGARKQRNVDEGFALSDHADWPGLLKTIKETEAEYVLTTHGNVATFARYLNELGIKSDPLVGSEFYKEED